MVRWSYVDSHLGLVGRAREVVALLTGSQADVEAVARGTVADVRAMGRRLDGEGLSLGGLEALDVGPGQLLRHMRCLSRSNRVTGIDTDLILQGLRDYPALLATAPPMRSAKTLGRRLLGRDRRFEAALARLAGGRAPGRLPLRRMDAAHMAFEDGHFDLVYSFSALEHVPDPAGALGEIARVLRDGGVAHLSLHLYTSHSGQHDARVMFRGRPVPPLWPHLRPAHAPSVHPATYVNGLRLDAWRAVFRSAFPGVRFVRQQQSGLVAPLSALRDAGELSAYGDDELLTVNLIALWKKGAPSTPAPDAVEWVP